MDYRGKLTELGIDVYKVRGKQGKVICPKCSHTRKKKTDPCLSVNIEDGWYNCHNCGWKGNIRDDEYQKRSATYTRPTVVNQTDCGPGVLEFFQNRGINQMTLIKNKVKEGSCFFPQVNEQRPSIEFNFFRNGEIINIKHRDVQKNFRLEKNAELIFYGLDNLKDDDKYIVITEGEIDALSFFESGIHYAISVPNGASKQSSDDNRNIDLQFLDNCWDFFRNDKIVIIATDSDTPGILLREEISRRIGRERCRKVDFKDCKDANEYLVKYGPDKLRMVVSPENIIEYPLEGIVTADDMWDEVEILMNEGLSKGLTTGVFHSFDDHISFEGSKLCTVTGIPNSGKSPFIDQIKIILSIKYGWKWGVCSMESKPLKKYIVKLAEKISGQWIRPGKTLTDDKKSRIKDFINNHFFFIEANEENDEQETLEFILKASTQLVRKYGIKGLVIDPWNKIEHDQPKGESETHYVSKTLDKLIRHIRNHDLFCFLVAHPAKPKKTKMGEYDIPDLYSISGSANFYNKSDMGITVHRDYKSEQTIIWINKMKDDHLGKTGKIGFKYNFGNGRLYETHNGKPDYGFWLDSLIFDNDLPVLSNDDDSSLPF